MRSEHYEHPGASWSWSPYGISEQLGARKTHVNEKNTRNVLQNILDTSKTKRNEKRGSFKSVCFLGPDGEIEVHQVGHAGHGSRNLLSTCIANLITVERERHRVGHAGHNN